MNTRWNDTLTFLARILLAYLFIQAGWGKLFSYEGTAGYMASQGVSAHFLPLVILLELGGGLAILAGFMTRFTALSIAFFSLVSGVMFHFDPSSSGQMINFYKNFSVAGGYLALAALGAGSFSVDHWLSNKLKQDTKWTRLMVLVR
ncbi:DoxX family protein [Vibrio crassostreae]|uniref:DoxX family protein n=1 Tax=Vibrio crassostreae TaxID=246167 RepID=UPI000639B3A4|nr:DoxX family protein [Vibrio crassostreae]ROS69358.1 putative oxidoreductase [Vibrio crassostreae]TCO02681.1 putative oxidoreductase [Vibrio crassostreae]CAK1976353.1 DoxX family protein [Vibrio crassostreae]CAK2060095.1 DoxX family protein [Vibrio crassostreae]CAK2061091.1 DoxX family protein [Vibrio crassostreae]